MWFGKPGNGGIDVRFGEDEAREVIRYAWDAGINFFDTANYYSRGASEEVLGKVIAEMGVRDDAVIATKSYYPMYEGTNAKGVTRKTLFREVDASLFGPAEAALDAAIVAAAAAVPQALQAHDYPAALKQLAALRGPIDAFFDEVMIMDEDRALRENRLRLLNKFVAVFADVADFGKLAKKA